jgi:hypothetical protein
MAARLPKMPNGKTAATDTCGPAANRARKLDGEGVSGAEAGGSRGPLGHGVEGAALVLDDEDAMELREGLGRIVEDFDDRFAVVDAEPDSFVTASVSDEQNRGGVLVAGLTQALGELEYSGPRNVDAGEFHANEFHANPHRQPGGTCPAARAFNSVGWLVDESAADGSRVIGG